MLKIVFAAVRYSWRRERKKTARERPGKDYIVSVGLALYGRSARYHGFHGFI